MTRLPFLAPASGSRLLGLIALSILTGCDGDPEHTSVGADAPIVIQASDIHLFGTSEEIAVVQDLEILPDGRVWVLNSVEPFFVGFDPQGKVIHEYGAEGGGPEEFKWPSAFVSRGMDGEAWALDAERHALIEVSRPESAWSEISLPRDSIPPGSLISGLSLLSPQVRTARLGDEVLLTRSIGSLESGLFSLSLAVWGADLLAMNRNTTATRRIVALGDAFGDPRESLEAMGELPPVLLWFRLWDVCSGSDIRVYDRLSNQVRGFAGDGTELPAIALPPVTLNEVTPEQFARAVFDFRLAEVMGEVGGQVTAADTARIIREIADEADWDPPQLAAVLPRYVDFRCTEEGTLWMRPFDPDVGGLRGSPTWLRITPDGATQEVRLPDRFDPHRFTSDRIWGVQRDELDVASVAWITAPGATGDGGEP